MTLSIIFAASFRIQMANHYNTGTGKKFSFRARFGNKQICFTRCDGLFLYFFHSTQFSLAV